LLIRSKTAKDAAPFCPYMVHDHYLALCAARKGKIVSLDERLINYRIHENNQTLMMAGVKDKESYRRIRIETLIDRLAWLQERFRDDLTLSEEIGSALRWAQARKANFTGDRSAKAEVMRGRRFSPLTSLFEVVFSETSDRLFMFFIMLKRRNVL
jgi:hypothetical protein